jgi:hypothetical protein
MPALTGVHELEHALCAFDNEHIVPPGGFREGHNRSDNRSDNRYDRDNMPATGTGSAGGGGGGRKFSEGVGSVDRCHALSVSRRLFWEAMPSTHPRWSLTHLLPVLLIFFFEKRLSSESTTCPHAMHTFRKEQIGFF